MAQAKVTTGGTAHKREGRGFQPQSIPPTSRGIAGTAERSGPGSSLIITVTFSSSLPDMRVLLLNVKAGDLGTVTGSAFFSGTPCSEEPVRSYARPSAKKTPQRNNLTAQDILWFSVNNVSH